MPAISGKNGNVYGDQLDVINCDGTLGQWNEQVVGGVTQSAGTAKVGDNSAQFVTVGIGAGVVLGSEVLFGVDLSSYKALVLWVKSSINTNAGDLRLLLDNTANCASPLESLQIPALTANVWTRVLLPFATPANLTSIISIGLKQQVDLANATFNLDDIWAVKNIAGIDSWSVDYKANTEEVTDFSHAGVEAYIPTTTGWNGSFEGNKDGIPLDIGSEVIMAFGESNTIGQCWIGNVIITGVTPTVAAKGVVKYKYTFVGSGDLQAALL